MPLRSRHNVAGSFKAAKETKHRGRGRPRKGDEGDFLYYLDAGKLSKSPGLISEAKLEGACFVIATNDLRPPIYSENALRYYMKQQQGVERAFRFLKDPEYFTDAFFLKKPERIAALLCVMTIALLLFSLSQRRLRLELEAKNIEVRNQKGKPTKKPTMRWVSQHFEGVDVTRVKSGDETAFRFHRLEEFESEVLRALGPDYEARYTAASLI